MNKIFKLVIIFNSKFNRQITSLSKGFTIVELLVVIVVIGILASITIISYTGVFNRAKIVSIQSDLSNASKQLNLFQVTNSNGDYPTTIDCSIADSQTNKCIKSSTGNSYTYTPNNAASPKTFLLNATNGALVYQITNDSPPTVASTVSLAVSDPANWLAIGTQVWAKYNLNVGTRIAGAINQTNNGGTNIIEKYCYGDTDAGCTNTDANGIVYGGLYQWDEAMKYTPTPATDNQGICPTGSHIPTDNEWKILEMQLGMTQVAADATSLRGTDQGTKLKSGGSSGLNLPFAGYRGTSGSFSSLLSNADFWSSSEFSPPAWGREIISGPTGVFRGTYGKTNGFSVRCVGN